MGICKMKNSKSEAKKRPAIRLMLAIVWSVGFFAGTSLFLPGCVFLELRDELIKTQQGLARTNTELQSTSAQIGAATHTLGDQAVPAINNTAGVIREAKSGLEGAANLVEPMREMRAEMQAMRGDLIALKKQLAEAIALVPALRQVGELREPMERVAALREPMNSVALLRDPMGNLPVLREPMERVAELRAPLLATGQLVEPMKELAAQSKSVEQSSERLGQRVLFYGLLGLVLWMLATALGVFLGMRLSR